MGNEMETKASPEVVKDAMNTLEALALEQDGKPVAGQPAQGLYKIAMRRGMTFFGSRDYVVRLLAKAFPGCEFVWK